MKKWMNKNIKRQSREGKNRMETKRRKRQMKMETD